MRDVDEPRIRAAGVEDAEAVLAFWKRAAEGVSVSDDLAGVRGLVERDPEALILAEQGGELVGTVIAGFDGWRCHLYRLAVAPSHRRQGVATALLAAAERRFTALGGRRADAMVLNANELAHHAWRARGYERQPHWGRWVKPLLPADGAPGGASAAGR
jgi:ribosomal protein S18 acetylase RimI-like enzyme